VCWLPEGVRKEGAWAVDTVEVTHLIQQPDADRHLQRVVSNEHVRKVERLAILHPARARGGAEVNIRDQDSE